MRKGFFGRLVSTCDVPYAVLMDRIHVDLDKPWLTVTDICEYMDVSTFVVTSLLRTGALPAVKFGREWRVSRDDFEEWINQRRRESVSDDVDDSRGEPHSQLADGSPLTAGAD